MSVPFRADDDGVRLAVRLTPRAKRDEMGEIGVDPDGMPVFSIRVAAPPVDGAANKALVAFLAKSLGMAKSRIAILSGETARRKLLFLSGEPDDLIARLRNAAKPKPH